MRYIGLAVLISVFSAPLPAQWNYPTARVPRTADGKPDLSAPTPRTADGKPDFTGTWDVEHDRQCPPGGCVDFPVTQSFGNIAWNLKDGLPYQPWRRRLRKSGPRRSAKTIRFRIACPSEF